MAKVNHLMVGRSFQGETVLFEAGDPLDVDIVAPVLAVPVAADHANKGTRLRLFQGFLDEWSVKLHRKSDFLFLLLLREILLSSTKGKVSPDILTM